MNSRYCLLFFIALSFATATLKAQISDVYGIRSSIENVDPIFLETNQFREIIYLNENWKVYKIDNSNEYSGTSIPSYFSGEEEVVYSTKFRLSQTQIKNNNLELKFLGLNYTAEVLLNDVVIYKHLGGLFPFSIILDSDILKSSEENLLKVIIQADLDSQTSIPLAQRFLFPKNRGGILRDVFLLLKPKTGISDLKINHTFNPDFTSARLNVNYKISLDENFIPDSSQILNKDDFRIALTLYDALKNRVDSLNQNNVFFGSDNNYSNESVISITNPNLWTFDNPTQYILDITLYSGNRQIDKCQKYVSLYELDHSTDNFLLNGKEFKFDGTTYFERNPEQDALLSFNNLKMDFRQIKDAGFNSVRFAKSLPHPYALFLCNQLGIFAFIEIPLNSIPDEFVSDLSFKNRTKGILNAVINSYSKYSAVIAIGVGSSFLSNSPLQHSFVNELAGQIHQESNLLTYASFIGMPQKEIENLDLIGVEIFGKIPPYLDEINKIQNNQLKNNKIFISEATYPTYLGTSSGYLNEYSIEGQAKFIDDVISFTKDQNVSGYFINSMFDFTGDFISLFCGYDDNTTYKIGILDGTRKADRISYKLLMSKLKGGERVTIPLGDKKDDSPILFIIVGVILSVMMALLINSKRKFREDATRALLRPYNFFADIRDLRIFSGVHSIILMLIIAGTFSVLLTILLNYLKNNILLEKTILSFNLPWLAQTVGFLAWHPFYSLGYLFIFSVALIFLHSGVIKFSSFFIKTRVSYSNIFYTVVWAFLPITLFLPIELILHRLLSAQLANIYIYGVISLHMLWLIQRLLKGVYVIFDIRGIIVYLTTFLFFIMTIGGMIIYFQITESTVFYIINSIKQYQLL